MPPTGAHDLGDFARSALDPVAKPGVKPTPHRPDRPRPGNRSVALRFIGGGLGARFRARSGSRAGLRQALACARYAADPHRHSLAGKAVGASACLATRLAIAVNRERAQARCRRPIGGFKRITY
jgi:hypothetical protein